MAQRSFWPHFGLIKEQARWMSVKTSGSDTFWKSFFPPYAPLHCNAPRKCSGEIVPSNQCSQFVLFRYLMEGWNERLSTNSWPIHVRGWSPLEVTAGLISVLNGAILGCLLAKYKDENEIWKPIRLHFLQQECFSVRSLAQSENIGSAALVNM